MLQEEFHYPKSRLRQWCACEGKCVKLAVMQTPCVKICTYDPDSGLCLGCGRTLDEIGDWFSLTAAERRAVMEALPARLSALKPAS